MEVMDVPDLPEGAFDFPMPNGNDDDYPPDNNLPMPDDFMAPDLFQTDEAVSFCNEYYPIYCYKKDTKIDFNTKFI